MTPVASRKLLHVAVHDGDRYDDCVYDYDHSHDHGDDYDYDGEDEVDDNYGNYDAQV